MPKTSPLLFLFVFSGFVLANITSIVAAQEQGATPSSIAEFGSQSPTAASLGVFGDVPVNLHTGTPSVEIPLYELRGRTLSVPITLRYHSSGVKVDAAAPWVGLGWALDAGGVVTRTVRGLPDESQHGYINKGYHLYDPAIWDNFDADIPNQSFLEEVNERTVDTQPDLFYFNFMGQSGKFVIPPKPGGEGQIPDIVSIPKQNLRIEVSYGGFQINEFIITTEDGTKFTFGETENTTSTHLQKQLGGGHTLNSAQETYMSSWFLTRIDAPSGNDFIEFTYAGTVLNRTSESGREYTRHISGGGDCGEANDVRVVSEAQVTIFEPVLETIRTAHYEVTFTTSSRQDGLPNENLVKLDRITVVAKDDMAMVEVKRFEFDYVYGGSGSAQRLFLEKVTEYGGLSTLPPYKFGYHGQSLPPRYSYAQDHWGFANGQVSNTTSVPAYTHPHPTHPTLWIPFEGANREPNESASRQGVLERITYPTGGYTQLAFEGHKFSSHLTGEPVMAHAPPSIAIAQTSHGSPPDVKEFTIDALEPVSVGIEIETHCLSPTGGYGGIPIDCRAQIYSDDQGFFHEFIGQNDIPIVTTVELPPGIYYLKAIVEDTGPQSGDYIKITANWQGQIPLSPQGITGVSAGGVRISKIEHYDGDNQRISMRRYDYMSSVTGLSSGAVITKPAYAQQFTEEPFASCTYVLRSSVSRAELGSTGGSHIGYYEVHEYHDETGANGKVVHTFRMVPDESAEGSAPHGFMYSTTTSQDWQRGQPLSSMYYSGGDVLIQGEQNEYFIPQSSVLDQYTAYRGVILRPYKDATQNIRLSYWNKYEIISAWPRQIEHKVTHYGNEAELEMTTSFEYETSPSSAAFLNMRRQVASTPGYPTFATEYTYGAEEYAALRDRNMVSQMIRTDVYQIGGTHHRSSITRYKQNGGSQYWVPADEYIWRTDYPGTSAPAFDQWNVSQTPAAEWVRTRRYDNYDGFGRPIEVSDAYDSKTFLYFGDNSSHFSNSANGLNSSFLTGIMQGVLWYKHTYSPKGELITIEDANNAKTRFFYDAFGRLEQTRNDANQPVTSYEYHYSASSGSFDPNNPNYVRVTAHAVKNISETGTTDIISTEFFDGLGRPIQSHLRSGSLDIVSAVQYDQMGRPAFQWKPYVQGNPTHGYRPFYESEAQAYYDGTSSCKPASNNMPYVKTEYCDDPLNRVKKVTPEGSSGPSVDYGYTVENDPGGIPRIVTTITNEDGQVTRSFSDAFGNQVRTIAAAGTAFEARTKFTYDVLGNVTHVTSPTNLVTVYKYNTRGLLRKRESPDAGDTRYWYNRNGNLRVVQDANQAAGIGTNGKFTYYKYDSYGRMRETGVYTGSETISQGSVDNQNWPSSFTAQRINYNYDEQAIAGENLMGRLNFVAIGNSYLFYSYDKEGRVTRVEHYPSGAPLSSALVYYSYDRQGNVTRMRYRPGTSDAYYHWYGYDNVGRLSRVWSNNVDSWTTKTQELLQTYCPTGHPFNKVYGDTMSQLQHTYNIRGWLTSINDPNNLTGIRHFGLKLGYDQLDEIGTAQSASARQNGNIAWMAWGTQGNNFLAPVVGYTFEYDPLNRLKSADFGTKPGSNWAATSRYDVGVGSGNEITYDKAGNITKLRRRNELGSGAAINYTYTPSTNRLASVSGGLSSSFTYDNAGNMLTDSGRGITDDIVYDYRNLPTQVKIGSQTVTFTYDHNGNRIRKQVAGGPGSHYIRGAGGEVLAVYDEDGQLLYWNILTPSGEVIGKALPLN